jgi:hypothetical protein
LEACKRLAGGEEGLNEMTGNLLALRGKRVTMQAVGQRGHPGCRQRQSITVASADRFGLRSNRRRGVC